MTSVKTMSKSGHVPRKRGEDTLSFWGLNSTHTQAWAMSGPHVAVSPSKFSSPKTPPLVLPPLPLRCSPAWFSNHLKWSHPENSTFSSGPMTTTLVLRHSLALPCPGLPRRLPSAPDLSRLSTFSANSDECSCRSACYAHEGKDFELKVSSLSCLHWNWTAELLLPA